MVEAKAAAASGWISNGVLNTKARLDFPRILLGGVLLGLALVSSAWALLAVAIPLRALASPGVAWRFETGPQSSCTWKSGSPADGALLCPQDYGAFGGRCEDGSPGLLLVKGRGTGWLCAPRSNGAPSRVSMLCCR